MSPSVQRPNVLLVVADQHRPDFVGMDPDVPVRTPALESLAERGVWFENAVCPSPLCSPSRACLASGMAYDRCRVQDNGIDYPLAAPTLYGRLRDDAGYHVAACGNICLLGRSRS
jgi:choline-sulfatase